MMNIKEILSEINDYIALALPSITIVIMIFVAYIIATRGLK